jgi:excisionase family DNA binding protein
MERNKMVQTLDKDLLTVAQTADYLGFCKQTILRLILDGKLEAHQIGSGKNSPWRITSVSIEKLMEVNRNR